MRINKNSHRAANTMAIIEKAPIKILFYVIIVIIENICKSFWKYRLALVVLAVIGAIVFTVYDLGYTAAKIEVIGGM